MRDISHHKHFYLLKHQNYSVLTAAIQNDPFATKLQIHVREFFSSSGEQMDLDTIFFEKFSREWNKCSKLSLSRKCCFSLSQVFWFLLTTGKFCFVIQRFLPQIKNRPQIFSWSRKFSRRHHSLRKQNTTVKIKADQRVFSKRRFLNLSLHF